MDPPDVSGDIEPIEPLHLPDRNKKATGVYQSFRSKMFNYKQLEEGVKKPIQSPKRQRQSQTAKANQRPYSNEDIRHTKALQGQHEEGNNLLIDLGDNNVSPASSHRSQKPKQYDAISLMEASVSEKYGYLPPPMTEQSKTVNDPFKVEPLNLMVQTTPNQLNRSFESTGSSDNSFDDRPFPPIPNRRSIGKSTKGIPDIPPRVYANVRTKPGAENTGPSEAKTCPASGTPVNNPQVYAVVSKAPASPRNNRAETCSAPQYSVPPLEDYLQSSSCVHHQQSTVSAENLCNQVNEPQPKEVDKAFSWLPDALSGLALNKEKDKCVSANLVHSVKEDKTPLKNWDCKELVPSTSSKCSPAKVSVGNSVFYDEVPVECEYMNTVEIAKDMSKGARPKAVAVSQISDTNKNDEHKENDAPPPLPPRAPIQHKYSGPPVQEVYANVPPNPTSTILPIIQDGHQMSKTHYWLLPDKDRQLAEVKPYNVSPKKQQDSFRQQQGNKDTGAGVQNQGYMATLSAPPHSYFTDGAASDPNSSAEKIGAAGGFDERSVYMNITGDTKTRPSNRPLMYSRIPSSRPQNPMGDIHEKVQGIQQQVHGVTDEECMTALQGNNWETLQAVKYLKIEQLFRLSVASREKCRKLLDLFNWNLEMAGSALLDEYSAGSSV